MTTISDTARSELTALLGLASNKGLSNTDLLKQATKSGYFASDLSYDKYAYSLRSPKDEVDQNSWYQAIAARKTKRANIILMGASIAEGYQSNSYDKVPAQALAKLLRQQYGISGGGRGFMAVPSGNVFNTAAQPFTFTGGAFDQTAFNSGSRHIVWYTTTPGDKVTWTVPPEGITSFVIQYIQGPSAGTAYYKIGAAAQVQFSTVNAAVGPARKVVNTPVAGGTVIEVGNVANYFIVDGIQEFNGDESSGIQVHNLGFSGYSTGAWQISGGPPDWATAMTLLSPDLIIMTDFGINDGYTANGNVSAATFKTNLTNLIAQMRARGLVCPILLCADYDTSQVLPMVDTWDKYVTALQQIASSDPTISFADFRDRMLPSNKSTVLYAPDGVHCNPSGAGSLLIAQILRSKVAV